MTTKSEVIEIPVRNIHPNPDNPRYEAGDVTGLSKSIGEDGLIQHLLVIPAPRLGPDQFMIEDGYCRWVAAKETEETLPCIVRYPEPDENLAFRAVLIGLITDEHKTPLTAMERANGYGRLRDEWGMTQEQIGQRVGLTPSTISRYLSLLTLTPKSQEAVRTGKLTVEKAVKAVQQHRAKERDKKGQKPVDVGWEPDWLSGTHHLARRAKAMCEIREHSNRRRLGSTACGACWETVIRADEAKVLQAQLSEAGLELPSALGAVPITPDGGIRANGVKGAR